MPTPGKRIHDTFTPLSTKIMIIDLVPVLNIIFPQFVVRTWCFF